MKNNFIYALIFFICIIFLTQLTPQIVYAQKSGIKISPVIIDDMVSPGQVFKSELKITNEFNSPQKFYVYLRDFKAEGETGKPKLIAPGSEQGYFLASWIEIAKDGIEFDAKEEKIIKFIVRIPADVGPGGYYGAILFGTKAPKAHFDSEDKGAAMTVAQQTGALLLLQVKGDALEETRVREFTTDKKIYNTPFDVNFLIRLENIGNVHLKPYGTITIKNMFGKEINKIFVNEKKGNILPHSIRKYNAIWKGKNGFGKYTANLGLIYGSQTSMGGQGKQSLFSQVSFWIIPWKIIIPVFLTIIFLIAIFVLFLRFYKNKAVKKAMSQAGLRHVKYIKKQSGQSPLLHFSIVLLIILILVFTIMSVIYFIFFA